MSTPNKQIRGIRQGIRAGSVLGRLAGGTGATEEIAIADLTNSIINTGQVITAGGANPQQWTAGKVGSVSTGLTVASGELIADWQIATIVSNLAGTISISSGTLGVAQHWNTTDVSAIGTGLTINAGTLSVTGAVGQWTAGSVAVVGAGLTITSQTLTAQWRAGTVTAIGSHLTLNAGTLNAANSGMLPLVNGDRPGPGIIADPYGQCVGVPL